MNITLPGKAATLMASQRERAEKQREQLGIEARSWYRITNAASSDEAEVMLYDEVGGWYGATADQFIADLRGVTAPNLRVRINSPGGSVFEGIAIANALRSHPANVTVQVDGIAASIASVIAMAGDRIEMAPNTMLMIHDASGLCMGNASDMAEMEELLDLISDNIADAYAARAGGTREQWRERMRAETWYLPDDAVENGLADEAITTPKAGEPAAPDEDDEPEMARAFDLAAYGYAGPRWAEPEPKPAQVTLTFNLGESIDEHVFETLRQMVNHRDPAPEVAATPAEPQQVPDEPAEEPAPEPAAVAEPEPETPAVEPVDEWAAAVAHLTQPKPDPWAEAFAHLAIPQPSSSAATAA
ncbi:head maturation protease, ClpP-related [Streptomyces sp. NBC_01373]|uniref:head maturation protease, ClpP-related n=1 Tax=Streptomyces sp. NBC_01373 TaxID=2903843 RepID=UPI00224F8007|nr:head maturation protease, ClpP-related [Streptomyces sp. NBC_01373]MCX4703873.1 Clp protease ClpP [Streptomyces sp. NBC_01373]